MEELIDGVIWSFDDNQSEYDFMLAGADLPTLELQDDIRFQYNQYKREETRQSCTLFAAACALGNVMNYQFKDSDFDELNQMSYDMWRSEWRWWYIFKAVDCVRTRWNNNMDRKALSFRTLAFDQDWYQFMEKWYNGCTIYNGNYLYNRDRDDNWVVDWEAFTRTYWHAVATGRDWNSARIVDSAKWRATNKYRLGNYQALIRNNVFLQAVYFFAEEKAISKSKEQFMLEANIRVLEKAIWKTWRDIEGWQYKLNNYSQLEEIQKLYEKINPLHRSRLISQNAFSPTESGG